MLRIDDTTFIAATKYAKLGYAVLPLVPGEKRPHPRLAPNGLKDATRDLGVLRRWWTQNPYVGIGILPPAQVLVLDFDSLKAWEQLTSKYPDLLLAPQQKTPRGGRHVFLRLPDGIEGLSASTATLAGVDVRGLGKAYVAAAPTRLPSGAYEWAIDLVAPDRLPLIPDMLLAELLPAPTPPAEFQPRGFRGAATSKRAQLLEGLLRWACERVASASIGTRHVTLLRYSRLVGGYLHHGLDLEHAAQALAEAGKRAGLPDEEASRTARDGLGYGQKAPIKLSNSTPTSKAEKPEPAAKKLVELATTHAELWHDERQRGWATVEIGGHKENWPLASRRFELWLSKLSYETWGKAPGTSTIADVQGTLEAMAVFSGVQHSVFLRVGHRPGEVWLDLGRPDWQAIRVTAAGWEVVAPEIRFRRSAATGALPLPATGSGGAALREILDSWELDEPQVVLLIAWLLGVLSPGPYPVLALTGEQGSGKSTLARMLQRLIDPTGDLGTLPRDSGELFLAASNSHILAFDNVSHLPPWLSDDLCKVTTGGLLRRRQLYTNDEEAFFKAKNPIILNGIGDYLGSQDLIDRSIVLQLYPVGLHTAESELWKGFERLQAKALGDLLDLAALALLNLRDTPTPSTRMADFARWALAAESGYARPGVFESAFFEMRGEALQVSLDNDPVYPLLLKLLNQGRFEGSAKELLEKLVALKGEAPIPPTPRAMSSWLKRAAPALRQAGIHADPLPRKRDKRGWVLEKVSQPAAGNQDEERQVVPADQAEQKEWSKTWQTVFRKVPRILPYLSSHRPCTLAVLVDGRLVRTLRTVPEDAMLEGEPSPTTEEWLLKQLAEIAREYPNPQRKIDIFVGLLLVERVYV